MRSKAVIGLESGWTTATDPKRTFFFLVEYKGRRFSRS